MTLKTLVGRRSRRGCWGSFCPGGRVVCAGLRELYVYRLVGAKGSGEKRRGVVAVVVSLLSHDDYNDTPTSSL